MTVWNGGRSLQWLALIMVSFVSFTTSAALAESPAVYMQRVQNELIAAQRNGGVVAFSNVLRSHMDSPGIGLTALGPHARTLPKTERPAYYAAMINFIAKYAAKTAPQYPVARATVVGQGPGDAGGTNVDARITMRTGESYDIRWLVVKSGSTYKVRDAQVVGFWMTSFLNDLFQNYISENGNNPRALILALSR
ncbi:toluene tolerance protein [Hyphomicrobium methylovorum]|uniref:ABC transporter substrate-binding protein n=1 Tax=Hyphomicrobium methylovorum TaxID=84 RepID=UPI0015E7430D|nr:ABC transporter substrate-binding protein [Hyphomicrobium methylovorum]MBA2124815.1 toluene tolerance protein [Hyphomicrobium methylovorum]